MADRYRVGGNGAAWSSTSHWSTTSGGASGASVPTAADDVYLDANSGSLTITADAYCRSLNCTGYTGTLNHNTGLVLIIGDATAGAGNVALKFVSGMTYTAFGTAQIRFVSTNATVQDVEFGGKSIGPTQFNGAGGSWKFIDSYTSTGNGSLILTAGTLDTNNQSVTCRVFTNNSGSTRALTLGTSSVTINGTGINSGLTFSSTGLTLSAASSTITMTGANSDFQGGGLTYGTVVFSGSVTSTATMSGANTFGSLTFTGNAAKLWTISLAANQTVTGTFTVNGNSVTNRVLVASSAIGTARTITAATVSASNVDLRDITGAGAASWDLSAITGLSGDCGGNTNITFTSATTQTATGTASFTWSTHGWTSRVPLPQDTVSVPNAFTTGRTITMDMPRVGKDVTFSCTGAPALSSTIYLEFYGSLTLASGMGTINLGTNGMAIYNRSAATITSNGNAIGQTGSLFIGTSSLTFADAFSTTGTITNASGGTGWIVTNNNNITCASLQLFSAVPSTACDFGTSVVTLTTTASVNILGLPTNTARQGASNATFVISGASALLRTILWYGGTIGTLTYTVAGSPGTLNLGNSGVMGTINTLNIGSGRTVQLLSPATLTVGTLNITGEKWPYVYSPGNTAGYAYAADSAAVSLTGDMDLRFYGAANDWSVGTASGALADKANLTNQSSWVWYLKTDARMTLITSQNGSANTKIFDSSVPVPYADGASGWVRVTLDVDDGAGNAVCKFWTSSDGSTWSQLGSTQTSAGTTSIFDGTSQLRIGAQGTATGFAGKLMRFQMRNNILDDGSGIVFDADFTAKPFGSNTFTESSSNAATVTMSGAYIVGDGRLAIVSSSAGTAATVSKASGEVSGQYLSIKDSTATGGATFYAVDSTDVSGNTGWNFLSSTNGNFLQLF